MSYKDYHIVLASNSSRRKELLRGLDIDFEVKVLPDISENYPMSLSALDVALYISNEKADAYEKLIMGNELIITADTVVVVGKDVLGKPKSATDAKRMLQEISGRTHQVVTGVCLSTTNFRRSFKVITNVTFKKLKESEIDYYINNYKPYDKAGAYGIQEWIGYVGVTSLEGSYFNVMGLPIQRIWEELNRL